jgi:hypothetical protein
VDNRIRTWRVTDKALEGTSELAVSRFAHEGAILTLAFSTDGKLLVSTAADKTVKIWDAATITEKHLLEAQPDWSPGLALLDGGQLALGRLDGSVGFYDTATGQVAAAPKPVKAAMAKKAAPAKPEITQIEPGGVQSGATTAVTITGKNLAALSGLEFSDARLKAAITKVDASGTRAEVNIVADAAIRRGQATFTGITPVGESAPRKLPIDYLPQITVRKSATPTAG